MKRERRFALLLTTATTSTLIYLCVFNRLSLAGEREEGDSQIVEVFDNTSDEEFSVTIRPAVLKSIAEIAEVHTQHGNSESAAIWRNYAERFPEHDALCESLGFALESLELAGTCRDRSEFSTARRLYTVALSIIEQCKDQSSENQTTILKLCAVTHLDIAKLDLCCEESKEADTHIKTAKVLLKQNPEFRAELQVFCDLVEASLYDKTRNYQKAEAIYLRLAFNADPELKLSPQRVNHIKVTLARLYAKVGDSKKSNAAVRDLGELADENGELDPSVYLDLLMGCALSEALDGKLDGAAAAAQEAVDTSQKAFGVASLEYVEAIELMAQINLNRANGSEAIKLLEKSVDLRSGIFGKDHPSVSRTRAQIDGLRKSANNPH